MTDTVSQQAAIEAYMDRRYGGSEEVIRALPALPAVGGWLDIESAPRDGGLHLRWSKKFGFVVANQPPGCCAGLWVLCNGDWRGGSANEAMAATHWGPLPAPPNP